jgi:peptidoglycan/LPS O-acetylase OafA/YrhL
MLYADTWGDYFGSWSWNPPRPELTGDVKRRLVVQSAVGLPLTAIAGAGWLALIGLAFGRRREHPARLLVVLMPAAALTAVLFYAFQAPHPDGDTVKSLFLLPAVPAWALSFGFAVDVLIARNRRIGIPVAAVLAACAIVSFAYVTFVTVS